MGWASSVAATVPLARLLAQPKNPSGAIGLQQAGNRSRLDILGWKGYPIARLQTVATEFSSQRHSSPSFHCFGQELRKRKGQSPLTNGRTLTR
jgi:hypothetical protein